MATNNQLFCPFCSLDDSRIILSNTHVIAIFDGFPVSPDHTP